MIKFYKEHNTGSSAATDLQYHKASIIKKPKKAWVKRTTVTEFKNIVKLRLFPSYLNVCVVVSGTIIVYNEL